MQIEKILKIESNHTDKLEMILSNNIDLYYNNRACVSTDNFDKLISELLAWHENEIKK